MKRSEEKLTVFYDGSCPRCIRDRERYSALAGKSRSDICWLDINGRDEELQKLGIDPKRALLELHVQAPGERIYSELDAYILLMNRVPVLKGLAWFVGLPVVQPILSRLYRWSVVRRLKKQGRLE
ncbi:thiol-disulfide oxidoreductase DCC family protein [Motiliproteus sp. MSK22-1]|uniref:thiol-disulfide oxidoreductase DCC family protein n=1 Tax=Motiliproteus sp. MSK22-1 TaxID=1897630 RepID=UPI000976D2C4|nr:DUF393 domain-containing protein [Motiliproteus sp. MSK22-1]OMH25591.1 thiol-disulfide oxidoreductase [Motiliproteus sp. MSK22-1]